MKKAQTIRRIALGVFGAIIVVITIVVFIKHKNSKEDDFDNEDDIDDESNQFKDEQNIVDYSEEKIDKSDEELFKRVNKSKFKTISNENIKIENREMTNNTSNDEADNRAIMDNYFKRLDTNRKGKHF